MKQLSKWAGVLVIALLVTTRPTDISHATQGRTGSGHELQRDCGLYFEFLGRTGAGREETFEVDPFGMGYCAGLVRGVADSAGTLMGDLGGRTVSETASRCFVRIGYGVSVSCSAIGVSLSITWSFVGAMIYGRTLTYFWRLRGAGSPP